MKYEVHAQSDQVASASGRALQTQKVSSGKDLCRPMWGVSPQTRRMMSADMTEKQHHAAKA